MWRWLFQMYWVKTSYTKRTLETMLEYDDNVRFYACQPYKAPMYDGERAVWAITWPRSTIDAYHCLGFRHHQGIPIALKAISCTC